jgi:2-C-methyl-D-erythritol 4-phosphate cytidylyltransferase
MNDHLILVAGGSGSRMGAALPKQFLDLGGRPVLFRTLDRFAEYRASLNVVLVLHPNYFDLWKSLNDQFVSPLNVQLVAGGEHRFESVRNGLIKLDAERGVVAIHDAVRPFASVEVIELCYATAHEKGTAIPVVDVHQSLREIDGDNSRPVDRSRFKLVQTPQCFQIELIKQAYGQQFKPSFTDDASVVEHFGSAVHLVEGNHENVKLTTPSDLKMAVALLS